MVTNVTSLTGNGLKDWLIQRVSAVILAIYFMWILGYLLFEPNVSFSHWYTFVHQPFFLGFSVLSMIALIQHAWIGLWTVTTDYLKCTVLRVVSQISIALLLIGLFVWFLMILWG